MKHTGLTTEVAMSVTLVGGKVHFTFLTRKRLPVLFGLNRFWIVLRINLYIRVVLT